MPLDFMAVTDHDNWLGEVQLCQDPEGSTRDVAMCQELESGSLEAFFRLRSASLQSRRDPEVCGSAEPGPGNRCDQRAAHQWPMVQEMADAYHEPGVFTTFTAFEYSAVYPASGGWLHRNVFFRGEDVPPWGGAALNLRHSPERLWEWMDEACTGDCDVIAIPHNTNYGLGVVLAPNNADGTPFTADIIERRMRREPLIEIHQVKGNSEFATGLLTSDEECNFQNYYPVCEPGQRYACATASDYVRNALKAGLRLEADYGVNPFKFGFIASPDDHQSLAGAADEEEFATRPVKFGTSGGFGMAGQGSDGGPAWFGDQPGGGNVNNPGGLVGVWAEANTRDAIFDTLRRRETFGNSGPRIHLRFFAGWDYPADLDTRRDMLEAAYAGGVPMGSDLPDPPGGDAGDGPSFVVWATKDPASANLQKVQIVKGWATTGEPAAPFAPSGVQTAEQVYDVACADGLEPDPETHRCADNGARVDLSNCSYSTDLGAAELSTTWTDPDFDPAQRAFYYVRVLENPTCRWTTHRALARGESPPPADPPTVKERAWSSPIWYTPDGP